MKYCEICGRPAEEHHIVFRKKAGYMVNVELNKKPLCKEHHTGNQGPHLNRNIDIKYKLELQKKLFELFSEEYYKTPQIQSLLGLNEVEIFTFIKPLTPYKDTGFERMVIVLRCMGGKLYVK